MKTPVEFSFDGEDIENVIMGRGLIGLTKKNLENIEQYLTEVKTCCSLSVTID